MRVYGIYFAAYFKLSYAIGNSVTCVFVLSRPATFFPLKTAAILTYLVLREVRPENLLAVNQIRVFAYKLYAFSAVERILLRLF